MSALWTVLIYFLLLDTEAQIFDSEDFQTYPSDNVEEMPNILSHMKPENVRRPVGSDLVLTCLDPKCRGSKRNIKWEFKPCKTDFIPCDHFNEYHENTIEMDDWTRLKLTKTRECKHELEIKNINTTESGLYRCVINNQPIRTVEVDVIDIEKDTEVLDLIPSNTTVLINAQIIIQCKVHSKHPPAIWWFKQSDGSTYDVKYSDKFYNRINTSVQVYPVPNEENVYLSKLNIQNVSWVDSGVYVCVGVTEKGIELKNAVIKVQGVNYSWEPRTTFSLLFLIPLVFALVPITGWLCYFRKKKMNAEQNEHKQRKKLIKLIENSQVPVV